jgi:signal transduction histidine kinase
MLGVETRKKKKIFYSIFTISCISVSIILAILFAPTFFPQIREPSLTLKVGAYDNAPKVYQDENGEWIGFFPELLEFIAEEENWAIEWVSGSWNECLDRLKNGSLDIMIDVAYSPERGELYDFNQVAAFENWGLIYTGTSLTVNSFADLNNQTVAVLNNSIHYKSENGIYNLTQRFGITCNFVELKSYEEVFEYLEANPKSAGVVNRLFGLQYENNYKVVQTSLFFNPVDLKFAFPKGAELNEKLIARIDYRLIQMKENPESIYYELLQKYFFNEGEGAVIPQWVWILLTVISSMVVIFLVFSASLKRQVNNRTQEIKEINQELQFLNNILLESIHDPVVVVENTGNVILLNKSLKDLCSKLYRWEISAHEPFFSRQNALTIGLGAILTSQMRQGEKKIQLNISDQLSLENGMYFMIMFSKLARTGQSGDEDTDHDRYFFFLHDITQFVELENLRKRFVSTVSHELRTPITSINLTLSNLVKYRNKLDENKIAYMLEMLMKSGRVMADMIDDLLIASRIESGRMNLAPAELSIVETIQEIITQMGSNIQQKNITSDIQISESLKIVGDPKRIMQVFRILIDNAIKYSLNNTVIEIKGNDESAEIKNILKTEGICISIKDAGIGIPESDLPNLFNQFVRASNVGQIQGTGLGLVIAKELVELHNGKITVESIQNQGTTFRVYLPKKYTPK